MGQVTVVIGGRSYPLACRDGEETHLTELASIIESKMGGLTESLGAMSEPRLLLMAGILVADELFESRKHNVVPLNGAMSLNGGAAHTVDHNRAVDDEQVLAFAERLEALADSLENDLADAA